MTDRPIPSESNAQAKVPLPRSELALSDSSFNHRLKTVPEEGRSRSRTLETPQHGTIHQNRSKPLTTDPHEIKPQPQGDKVYELDVKAVTAGQSAVSVTLSSASEIGNAEYDNDDVPFNLAWIIGHTARLGYLQIQDSVNLSRIGSPRITSQLLQGHQCAQYPVRAYFKQTHLARFFYSQFYFVETLTYLLLPNYSMLRREFQCLWRADRLEVLDVESIINTTRQDWLELPLSLTQISVAMVSGYPSENFTSTQVPITLRRGLLPGLQVIPKNRPQHSSGRFCPRPQDLASHIKGLIKENERL